MNFEIDLKKLSNDELIDMIYRLCLENEELCYENKRLKEKIEMFFNNKIHF